jgi:predicted PurR-regulated permease PerM
MNDFSATPSPPSHHDQEHSDYEVLRAAAPFLGIVVATAVLCFARDILLPIAMASMLAVIFSPIAGRLERLLGRLAGTALVVLAAVAVLAALAYFMTVELTAVADDVAGYSTNIARKFTAIERTTPPWLLRVERAVAEIERRVQAVRPERRPRAIQTVAPPTLSQELRRLTPVLAVVVDVLLVIVLFFFLLYSREDLRDRILRLAARARITVARQAIETAGQTVSQYLMLFSAVNLGFGLATGLAMWLLGLPEPELWGLLGFLLRFVPYVGAPIAALLPTLVAFAVFPGWDKAVEALVAFIVLDQIAAQFVEPFVVGPGIGISPVALLISAMYWAWLWGPAGLLIATPITACIKVAGDYIPTLSFFTVLLGSEGPRKAAP